MYKKYKKDLKITKILYKTKTLNLIRESQFIKSQARDQSNSRTDKIGQ